MVFRAPVCRNRGEGALPRGGPRIGRTIVFHSLVAPKEAEDTLLLFEHASGVLPRVLFTLVLPLFGAWARVSRLPAAAGIAIWFAFGIFTIAVEMFVRSVFGLPGRGGR